MARALPAGCGRAARAASVISAPASMRAISSRRSASDRRVMAVRPSAFDTRQWCAPRAATWGEWVTTRIWKSRASRSSRSPTASATAPPTLASTSSNTRVGTGSDSASTTFSASMKRDNSPPELMRCSGPRRHAGIGRDLEGHGVAPVRAPGLVGQRLHAGDEGRLAEPQRFQFLGHGGIQACGRRRPGAAQGVGLLLERGPRLARRTIQAGQPRAAVLDRVQLPLETVAQVS